jgi:hypothetical protein
MSVKEPAPELVNAERPDGSKPPEAPDTSPRGRFPGYWLGSAHHDARWEERAKARAVRIRRMLGEGEP